MASDAGSTFTAELMAATTVRWPGMIQKNTLALMAVAIIAPTSRNAARPANSSVASHEPKAMTTNTSAPTMASPFLRNPNTRQMPSYSSQNATRNASAAPMAVGGAQSNTDLSIR